MKKHWTENLMEAGRPVRSLAEQQERRLRKIAALRLEIKALQKEYAEAEVEIEQTVLDTDPKRGWTPAEVNAAKWGEKVW